MQFITLSYCISHSLSVYWDTFLFLFFCSFKINSKHLKQEIEIYFRSNLNTNKQKRAKTTLHNGIAGVVAIFEPNRYGLDNTVIVLDIRILFVSHIIYGTVSRRRRTTTATRVLNRAHTLAAATLSRRFFVNACQIAVSCHFFASKKFIVTH